MHGSRRLEVLLIAALSHGLAMGATVETADSKERKPKPSEGSEVEVSFNPTVSVIVDPGESIESVIDRLSAEINVAGAGAYVAWRQQDTYELRILRDDGSEIDQLRFIENDPGIQSTKLIVDKQGLEAHLRLGQETPSRGALVVTLNDRFVAVTTTGLDRSRLVLEMFTAITNAGFLAVLSGSEIRVTWDAQNESGITRVGVWSTDPALVTSDCALQSPPPPAGESSPLMMEVSASTTAGRQEP